MVHFCMILRVKATFSRPGSLIHNLVRTGVLLLCGWSAVVAIGQTPVPFINSISPVAAAPGGGDFTLTVYGAGFATGALVNWAVGKTTTSFATNVVSATKLTATVPGTLLAAHVTAIVTVVNLATVPSNPTPFWVTTTTPDLSFGTTRFPNIPYFPNPIIAGDFNGDGKPDLAMEDVGEDQLTMLMNNGDGTFTPILPDTRFAGPTEGTGLATGDLNGDGMLDIVGTNFYGSEFSGWIYSVILGNGDGTFTLMNPYPTLLPGFAGPNSVAVGDFNGDGKLDFVLVNACGMGELGNLCLSDDVFDSGLVLTMLGNGDGTFNPVPTTVTTSGYAPSQGGIVVGDFNGDGKLDLAIADFCGDNFCQSSGDVSILLGNGDGTFTQSLATARQFPAIIAIKAGDFNGDGKLDVAILEECTASSDCPPNVYANETGIVDIFLGLGDGTFYNQPAQATGIQPYAMSIADFNGDGTLDIAVVNRCGKYNCTQGPISIFLNDGKGNLKQSTIAIGTGWGPFSMATADFNGDGRPDLAVATFFDSNVTVASQQPTFSIGPSSLTFSSVAVAASSAPRSLTLKNSGSLAISVSAISATGDFSQTNNCGASVAAGAMCTIKVVFTPTDSGARAGTVTAVLSDGTRNAQPIIALSGTGAAVVSLTPASISFGKQQLGTSSPAQSITIGTNGVLNISGIALAGSNPGDFPLQADNCPTKLAQNASCTVTLPFTPLATGPRSAMLTITDDGVAGSQSGHVNGIGVDFSITASPATENITLKQSATYTLTIAPLGGYVGTLTLSCGGLPPSAKCVLQPAQVVLGAVQKVSAQIQLMPPQAEDNGRFPLTFTATPTTGLSHSATATLVAGNIQMSPPSAALPVDTTVDLQVVRGMQNITSQFTSWSSSNPTVVTVTSTGHVMALSVGLTEITAMNNGTEVSTPVSVTPVTLAFATQPNNSSVLAAISPAVQVLVMDVNGHAVPGVPVVMSVGPNPPNPAVIGGTLTQITDSTGTATFPDLTLDYLGDGYTLIATTAAYSAVSTTFSEARVGDPCLAPDAPLQTCGGALACTDTDQDGLPDAWEKAGGVDFNGDGKIDAMHDLLLPGADPNHPDVYLKYDYMQASDHDHNPPAQTVQWMVDAYASHGVTLHVDPEHDAIPEQGQIVTVNDYLTAGPPDYAPLPACSGDSTTGGASSMHQLRESYFGNRYPAYHYLVFAHYVDCPNNYNYCSCRSFLLPGMTGEAELPGNDAIVSTGPFMDSGFAVEPETWSALMMHEVGHNFGLRHGGADDTNYKPNYLSVMNYDFEWSGVFLADAPGSINLQSCTTDADCTAPAHCAFPPGGLNNCVRIDYSSAQAPDLNENSLDETAGLNISPTSVDVGFYYALGDTVLLFAPTNGAPVDWNDDGNATETSVATDLNADFFLSDLQSRNDWATNGGILANFNFDFQCTSGWQGDGPPTLATRLQPTNRSSRMTRTIFSPEPTLDSARKHHRLYAPRTVSIRVNPGCSAAAKPVAAGQPGTIRVALLGADRFDVNDVDTSSLALHGAKAIGVSIQDINNDGKPDLVATFDSASVKVHPRASVARVTGWLKNSQAFFGEDKIKVVSSQAAVDAQCK